MKVCILSILEYRCLKYFYVLKTLSLKDIVIPLTPNPLSRGSVPLVEVEKVCFGSVDC